MDLVEQLDRIAFSNHSFREDGAVNSSEAVVSLRDFLQDGRRFLRRVGIERDHHAARITLQNATTTFEPIARNDRQFVFGKPLADFKSK